MTTLVGFVAIRGLVELVSGPLSGTIVADYAGDLLAGLIALSVFPALTLYAERRNVRLVFSIAARAGGPDLAPNRTFLTENLQQMSDQFDELQSEGAVLPRYLVARWVQWCFETATTHQYVGTDSHVPSQYRDIYAEYLTAHKGFIKRQPRSSSKRVMITFPDRLRADRALHPADNRVFFEWHKKKRKVKLADGKEVETKPVHLYQLDPHSNRLLLEETDEDLKELLDTDIGFWKGNFVLLFNPVKDAIDPVDGSPTHIRLRLRYKGEDLYKKCERYAMLLEEKAKPLNSELPIYSSQLSENWKRFAAPELRVKQTIPLITGVIDRMNVDTQSVRIFDAAAGVGFEAIALLRDGYLVQLNEIEGTLRDAARQYAKEHDVVLPEAQFSSIDWLELDREFQAGQFDVVLVLGNSLCHLESDKQLASAIGQFYKLLRKGGALICDERNFDFIREHWEWIQRDPLNNFSFNQREDRVMYLGTHVLGAPFEFNDRVIFEYWDVERGSDGKFRKAATSPLGSLSMFPFERGKLQGVLKSAGFRQTDVLCDLKPSPEDGMQNDCDFYTYVAWK
ncbi:MAG TPA: class I SAM-dependent methyltransferase [Solirubrobacterales bacterium]|nr:class I SAM-dependent methyltransferase [Solirubrobacterales bacterium]